MPNQPESNAANSVILNRRADGEKPVASLLIAAEFGLARDWGTLERFTLVRIQ
jgi:hypothetical protein